MGTGTQRGYDPTSHYVWGAPGGVSVHLSLKVVRELAAQIAASGETRGILLGRTITLPLAATVVDEFAMVPSFVDFASAKQTAENDGRGLRAVGFFQSQRDDRLRLGPPNVPTLDGLLNGNGNLALLIRVPRRGHAEADLYYWQDGRPKLCEFGLGFPFDEKKLASGHPDWRFQDWLEPGREAPARAAHHPTPEAPAAAPGEGIRWFRLLPTASLVMMGIMLTELAWNSRAAATAQPAPVIEATTPATPPTDETPLGLKVTLLPHQLEIRWNRTAEAITAAVKGTMSMSEAGVTEAVPFDARELREGYIAYGPKTNDVLVRLEVTAADGTTKTESLRVVAIP
jgi:hypothetical protein